MGRYIRSGRIISCKNLGVDNFCRSKCHYRISFELDIFDEDTGEEVEKCIAEFPDLVSKERYLEYFIGRELYNIDMEYGKIQFDINPVLANKKGEK